MILPFISANFFFVKNDLHLFTKGFYLNFSSDQGVAWRTKAPSLCLAQRR